MNNKIITLIQELTVNKTPFPQFIAAIYKVGIVRYHADLVGRRKIYYHENGESYIHEASDHIEENACDVFNENGVIAALRAVQQGQIDYTEFLSQIVRHGVVSYTVFIPGRQAHYTGFMGDLYVEKFPD